MITRLAIFVLCASLTAPAMAADADTQAPSQPTTAAPAAPTPGNAPAPSRVITDILRVSGMRKGLEKMPASFVDGFHRGLEKAQSENGRRLPPDLQEAMENSARESFTADGFTGRVLRAMRKDYNEKSYQALLADLSTPLARRMAELGSKDAPSEQEFSDFNAQLANSPLSAQRIDLLHRLDAASRSTDLNAAIMVSIGKGTVRGIAGASGNCMTEAQLKKSEAAMEEKVNAGKANLGNMTTAMLAFTFRDVSDEDLAEYVGILEKENSRHIGDVIYSAIVEEFGVASTNMGHGMMQAMKAKKVAMGNHACEGNRAAKETIAQAQTTAPAQTTTAPNQASSAVPPAAPAPEQQSGSTLSKSSIPLAKRKGGDITQCLEAGSKSDRDIAACAEKYRR